MIINFIRHGKTVNNEEGIISGSLVDTLLSENGKEKLADLKKEGIYPEELGVCYISELTRTEETLNIIAPDKIPYKTSLLNEKNFGVLEFMSREDAQKYKRDNNMLVIDLDTKIEGGESGYEFYDRVKRDFKKVVDIFYDNDYKTVTIVGHGSYLRALAYNFSSDKILSDKDYVVDNGKGVVFEMSQDNFGGIILEIKSLIGGKTFEEIRGIRV